ncbi:MAG: cupin 2 barrel domain-containing protein [Spirochaetes bacterium]|nr:MAG: cupin 2 barrel domain-containing protein [Spirochaetota bacterium]
MIIKPEAMEREARPAMRGGKGTCTVTHLAGRKLQAHVKLFAEVLIPAGASIGRHDHTAETEYYLILEGSGTVDDNGAETKVGPGDVVVTTGGAFHSIEATDGKDIRMVAAIVTDA